MELTKKEKLYWLPGFLILTLIAYWPTFSWMVWRYEETNSYSSHGYLIPFISLWMAWKERNRLQMKNNGSVWGIWLVAIGIGIHLTAGMADISSISGMSLILIVGGFVLLLLGKPGLNVLWFPVLFLVFAVPLPDFLISSLNFKLKFLASDVAAWLLNVLGVPAIREGSFMLLEHERLAVGDVCSGLRSLLSLLALGVLFLWFIRDKSKTHLTVVALSIIPAAILGNGLRIWLVSLLVHWFGKDFVFTPLVGEWDVHLMTGMVIFAGAFLCLFGVHKIMDTIDFHRKGIRQDEKS